MADISFQTYQAIGNREHLTNFITRISPKDTPMYSGFAKTTATARLHEWQTDTLRSAAVNALVEGADIEAPALTATSRLYNYVQELGAGFKVTKVQEVVSKAGRNSEYAYQAVKAMEEIGLDTEYAIVVGTRTVGNATTGAKMGGVINAITTNTQAGGGIALTEANYNALAQKCYVAGGRPDTVYGGAFHKRTISGWTSVVTRNIDASDKRLIAAVDKYDGDFGMQVIIPHRIMGVHAASTVVILEKNKWALAILIPYAEKEEDPDKQTYRKGTIHGALTLEWRAETSSGKHTGLATA